MRTHGGDAHIGLCLVPAPAGYSHAQLRTRWCAIAGCQLNHSVRHMGRWLSNRGRYVPSNSSTLAQLRCAGAKKRYMWSWQTSIHVDAWRKAEPSQDIVSGAKEQRSNTAPVQTHNRRRCSSTWRRSPGSCTACVSKSQYSILNTQYSVLGTFEGPVVVFSSQQ